MPFFSSLDHDRGADYLSGSGDVDQAGFFGSGGHQDGRACKERLQVPEGFLGLGGPSEALGLPQEEKPTAWKKSSNTSIIGTRSVRTFR